MDAPEALRAFNRYYTRRIGVLDERLLESRFALGESRLLYELAHGPARTAASLARELGLDAGYLSRLLAGLRERGLVRAQRSAHDGRESLLTLTAAGRRAFAPLDQRARAQAAAMLQPLGSEQQRELLYAAARIEALLSQRPRLPPLLRAPAPGDMGWVIARHGALYAEEHGWDWRFEALVARIVADYVDRHDPAREACWIAERDGVALGCVFLVQARADGSGAIEPGIAQLRLLLVEPSARGSGLGKLLVDACTQFARAAGYVRVRLWTNSVLLAARAIYVLAGYTLVASEPHTRFGADLVGEVWELAL